MMFVLLFLFQFSMVIRDRQNTYDVNSNFTTRQKDGKNVWKNKQIDPVAVRTTDRSYALFVGDSSSDMATAVSRWCIYAKWDMAQCRNLEDYQENDKALPGMLILESEKYALGDNLEKLEKLEQKGVIIVFGCLENPKNIELVPLDTGGLNTGLSDLDGCFNQGTSMFLAEKDPTSYIAIEKDNTKFAIGLVVREEDKNAEWIEPFIKAFRTEDTKNKIDEYYKGSYVYFD